MQTTNLVEYPNSILSQKCHDVITFDRALIDLTDIMTRIMYMNNGVGLASPQVGSLERVIIIDPSNGNESCQRLILINPSVTWVSKEVNDDYEGCLSIPGIVVKVSRHIAVQVDYDDLDRNHHSILFKKFHSRIIQHEIDHLNGVVMLDKISFLKRKMALKDLGKD